ncbi:unnamed protein product, partial [Owenia fusiformis]
LDTHVSNKIKSKIWNGDYVDFAILIKNDKFDRHQLSIANNQDGEMALYFAPAVSKKALAFGEWQNAFRIYSTILTARKLELASELLKSNDIVVKLMRNGGN